MTLRLAMWSGPRNISTAMMRAWENRRDCQVVDEPFYACYLQSTGIDHPMRTEVITNQSTERKQVIARLVGSPAPIFYQKHMTHHMLPDMELSWTRKLHHCFLIRDPFEVIASYSRKRASLTTEDIGIVRQLELYEELQRITRQKIPVVDAKAVLVNPQGVLARLCGFFDIEFLPEMLCWPPGRRESDGVWAEHWYQAVERSTGFEPYRSRQFNLSESETEIAYASMPAYEALKASPTLIT